MLIIVGILIVAAGLAITLAGRIPLLGRLPGDLTVQGDRWTVYAPIATSIVLSVVLTVALNLIAWLGRR